MDPQSNAQGNTSLTVLTLLFIVFRSLLFWKTLFGSIILLFFISIVAFDFTCSCPDQQEIKAPLYATIAAASLCVNGIPVRRQRLSSPIQFDFFKWRVIFSTADKDFLRSFQARRNEAVLLVNVLAGAVAGLSTLLAGIRWLANESSNGEYTWLIICLGVIATSSIQLAAFARYTEERELRNEE